MRKYILILLIIIQALALMYFCKLTITKIGINEDGLLGFTTEPYYQNCAKNFAMYNIYSDGNYPDIEPTNFRPPLFPFLLSIVYKIFSVNEVYGFIFNNIFLLLTTIIIYKTGNLFNQKLGLLSALLFIAEPYLLERANSIQTEISHIFFFSLALYYAVKIFYKNDISNKNIILFSLLFFLSTFTRIVTFYYPIIFLIIMILIYRMQINLSMKHNLDLKKIAIIFLIINSLGTMAWSARNYIHTGNSKFAGMTGIHIGLFVAPGAYSQANNIDYSEARKIIRNKYFDNDYFRSLGSSDQQIYLTSIGKKIILDNPIGFIKWYIIQSKQLFLGYPVSAMLLFYSKEKIKKVESIMLNSPSGGIKNKLSILRNIYEEGMIFYISHMIFFKLFYFALFLSSVCGSILMVTDKSNNYQLIGIIISSIYYYLIGIYLFSAPARLRISLLPMMVLFSSYFLFYIKSYYSKD